MPRLFYRRRYGYRNLLGLAAMRTVRGNYRSGSMAGTKRRRYRTPTWRRKGARTVAQKAKRMKTRKLALEAYKCCKKPDKYIESAWFTPSTTTMKTYYSGKALNNDPAVIWCQPDAAGGDDEIGWNAIRLGDEQNEREGNRVTWVSLRMQFGVDYTPNGTYAPAYTADYLQEIRLILVWWKWNQDLNPVWSDIVDVESPIDFQNSYQAFYAPLKRKGTALTDPSEIRTHQYRVLFDKRIKLRMINLISADPYRIGDAKLKSISYRFPVDKYHTYYTSNVTTSNADIKSCDWCPIVFAICKKQNAGAAGPGDTEITRMKFSAKFRDN